MKPKKYNVIVVGATPAGIACAVRAAREGLQVLLTHHTAHLGGMIVNGLDAWDAAWEGGRSPIYDELRRSIQDFYRETYGADSAMYQGALAGPMGHANGRFEPHVAERIVNAMIAAQPCIEVLLQVYPAAARQADGHVTSVTFRAMEGGETTEVQGGIFVDSTYEGDLAAVCGAPYRVGRESRDEYNEPHAGRIYSEREPSLKLTLPLNLRHYHPEARPIPAPDSGQGDAVVQAMNYRTTLTTDPERRVPVEKPKDYDREMAASLLWGSRLFGVPNNKLSFNRPQLVGPHAAYPEGDWATRREIMQQHWDATLSVLWFLQHDESVDENVQKDFRTYGLSRDEHIDNGHRPHEIYVREARRILGEYVLTEHDFTMAEGIMRAPLHRDSVGFSDWYIDIHACHRLRVEDSMEEGKVILTASTLPTQIPYGSLLPRGFKNLLVPVCCSATHVAWGGVRLEPTWMTLGESAGFAAALATRRGIAPSEIAADELLAILAENRVGLVFFNDIDVSSGEPWISAVQYLATRGFFPSYDAEPSRPLTQGEAAAWAQAAAEIRSGKFDPMTIARRVAAATDTRLVLAAQFRDLLAPLSTEVLPNRPLHATVTRAQAAEVFYRLLVPPSKSS